MSLDDMDDTLDIWGFRARILQHCGGGCQFCPALVCNSPILTPKRERQSEAKKNLGSVPGVAQQRQQFRLVYDLDP